MDLQSRNKMNTEQLIKTVSEILNTISTSGAKICITDGQQTMELISKVIRIGTPSSPKPGHIWTFKGVKYEIIKQCPYNSESYEVKSSKLSPTGDLIEAISYLFEDQLKLLGYQLEFFYKERIEWQPEGTLKTKSGGDSVAKEYIRNEVRKDMQPFYEAFKMLRATNE